MRKCKYTAQMQCGKFMQESDLQSHRNRLTYLTVFLSAPGPAISALFCENLPSHSKRFYVTPTTTRHAKSLDALKKKMKKKLLLVEKVAKQRPVPPQSPHRNWRCLQVQNVTAQRIVALVVDLPPNGAESAAACFVILVHRSSFFHFIFLT